MSGAAEHNLRDAICRSPTCTASALLNGRESDQVTSAIDAVRLGQPKRTLRIANPAWVPCVCGVVVLQIALILHHEPFVDEWQALQIAVQSPDLASMLANLRYEGHPPLWYLLLRGLAMVVGPQAALPAASLIFALASQCLILFRAPFPRWLRLALALSEPVLFEYGTNSRSYTLGIALTLAALALWNRKREFWLPFALLPMVDALFGLVSLALLVLRFAEKRLWWPGVAAWLALSLLAAWTVIPAADFVPVYPPAASPLAGARLLVLQLSIAMVPFQWGAHGPEWSSIPPFGWFLVLWIPFAWLCVEQTRGRPWDRLALGGFLAAFLILYAFSHPLANRHVMLIGALLVALQWRQSLHGAPIRRFFQVWLAIGAACGVATAAIALAMPFDTAPQVARIIDRLNLRNEHWVSTPVQHAQGVSAITGILFEGLGTDCMNDFVRWNEATSRANVIDPAQWSKREALAGRFYLASQFEFPAWSGAVEIGRVPAGYDGKEYYLYRFGSDRAPPRRALPRCVPGMNPLPPRRAAGV